MSNAQTMGQNNKRKDVQNLRGLSAIYNTSDIIKLSTSPGQLGKYPTVFFRFCRADYSAFN